MQFEPDQSGGFSLDDLTEDWGAVKLVPDETGLSRSIWITENQGYQHDIRVKVSRVRGGGGIWPDAIFVSVRPDCEEIHRPRQLPSDDLNQVCDWIALNFDVIVDLWDGVITPLQAGARLRRVTT
jgi:hypothetical protein